MRGTTSWSREAGRRARAGSWDRRWSAGGLDWKGSRCFELRVWNVAVPVVAEELVLRVGRVNGMRGPVDRSACHDFECATGDA